MLGHVTGLAWMRKIPPVKALGGVENTAEILTTQRRSADLTGAWSAGEQYDMTVPEACAPPTFLSERGMKQMREERERRRERKGRSG